MVLLAGKISVDFSIGTQVENSVGIYSNQKILTEYINIFCIFLLVGLSLGLNPTNQKTQKNMFSALIFRYLKMVTDISN
jgi:hypothetical protein